MWGDQPVEVLEEDFGAEALSGLGELNHCYSRAFPFDRLGFRIAPVNSPLFMRFSIFLVILVF
jgi:hypothetical protein